MPSQASIYKTWIAMNELLFLPKDKSVPPAWRSCGRQGTTVKPELQLHSLHTDKGDWPLKSNLAWFSLKLGTNGFKLINIMILLYTPKINQKVLGAKQKKTLKCPDHHKGL